MCLSVCMCKKSFSRVGVGCFFLRGERNSGLKIAEKSEEGTSPSYLQTDAGGRGMQGEAAQGRVLLNILSPQGRKSLPYIREIVTDSPLFPG